MSKPRRKPARSLPKIGPSLKRIQSEGQRLVRRIRGDARVLISQGRSQVFEDVQRLRKDFRKRADATIRGLERQIAKQMHAATTTQVAALQRRIAKLERRIAELERHLRPAATAA
jgi:polyhydroxyalkanoate synthesis regulator phasin